MCSKVKAWYDGAFHDCIRLKNSSEMHYVEYDPERDMYRVTIFDELGHWQDELWFEAYRGEAKM